jgi:hypothetical protein
MLRKRVFDENPNLLSSHSVEFTRLAVQTTGQGIKGPSTKNAKFIIAELPASYQEVVAKDKKDIVDTISRVIGFKPLPAKDRPTDVTLAYIPAGYTTQEVESMVGRISSAVMPLGVLFLPVDTWGRAR